jgi:hypothetical protein
MVVYLQAADAKGIEYVYATISDPGRSAPEVGDAHTDQSSLHA